jgi:glucosamine 6-phosphate synthetase-like amidotransferase/phosphosugar isomerase protein
MVYDGEEIKLWNQRKVADLEEKAAKELTMNGTIGHTRWAHMVCQTMLIHIRIFLIQEI